MGATGRRGGLRKQVVAVRGLGQDQHGQRAEDPWSWSVRARQTARDEAGARGRQVGRGSLRRRGA